MRANAKIFIAEHTGKNIRIVHCAMRLRRDLPVNLNPVYDALTLGTVDLPHSHDPAGTRTFCAGFGCHGASQSCITDETPYSGPGTML